MSKAAPLCTVGIGETRVTFIPDGHFRIRPLDKYPASDQELWESSGVLDADGFLILSLGATLVQSGAGSLLIDLAQGPLGTFGMREVSFAEMVGDAPGTVPEGYATSGCLLDNLSAVGVAPEDIDAVCFTHLHMDHVGWLGTADALTFPNAEYFVARGELDYWKGVDLTMMIAGPPEAALSVLDAKANFIEDRPIPFPGLSFITAHGHTPGHVAYVIEGAGERLMVLGDAFHSSLELDRTDLAFEDDVEPGMAAQTRAALLRELTRPGTSFIAGHFSDSALRRLDEPRPAAAARGV